MRTRRRYYSKTPIDIAQADKVIESIQSRKCSTDIPAPPPGDSETSHASRFGAAMCPALVAGGVNAKATGYCYSCAGSSGLSPNNLKILQQQPN
jgi:hypothetical protein